MKDPITQKSEFVINALQYAHDHNLNINNEEDVKKILEVIDPKHLEDIDEFIKLLKNSNAFIEMTAKVKESQKTNLLN